MRNMLRNDQRERIEHLLLGKASDPGATAKDNRLFVEVVLSGTRIARLLEGGSALGTPINPVERQAMSRDFKFAAEPKRCISVTAPVSAAPRLSPACLRGNERDDPLHDAQHRVRNS